MQLAQSLNAVDAPACSAISLRQLS